MSFKSVETVLTSAVAQNGTFTVGYPTDHKAGDFASFGHSMVVPGMGISASQDDGGMSIAFTSSCTITYKLATTLPIGTKVYVTLNKRGQDNRNQGRQTLDNMKRMTPVVLTRVDLGTPDAADDNGIVESQNLTAAGVYSTLAFNGVYGDPYANQYAVLDVPRNVVAAWTTNAVLTVTGKDEYGDVIIEKSAGGSATFTGKKAFKVITSITTSVDITALTVGTGDVLGLPVYVDKVENVLAELQDGVKLSAFNGGKILIPFDFNQTDLLAPTAQNLVAPCAGYITGIRGNVQVAVTTGGAITVEANTVAVVGLSITVANSATVGTTHSDFVGKIATGLCAAGDDITVTPAAAFDTAGAYKGYIVFEPISELNGTFVAGVQTLPTATTGDVRGTYDPAEACDGSLSFSLLVRTPDPTYKGVDNYDG